MKPLSASARKVVARWTRIGLILLVAVLVLLLLFQVAFNGALHAAKGSLASRPNPAADYSDALNRVKTIQQGEGPELNPVARTILLTHGYRTEHSVVFFHGLTNSPQQFRQLAELIYDLGYNVFVPRLPQHGMADRRVENLTSLKAEELRGCADESVDIACGLGKKVYVAGLSAGGTMAAWIAQNRTDVARVLLIAPALGLVRRESTRGQKLLALLLPLLPDIRTDWFSPDPNAPPHAYPGFSSRALGQLLRISLATFSGALQSAPKVQDIALVTSKSDDAVNDAITWQLISLWRARGLPKFTVVDFPKEMKIQHDMIDPAQNGQQTAIVYPILIGLLNAP